MAAETPAMQLQAKDCNHKTIATPETKTGMKMTAWGPAVALMSDFYALELCSS